MGKGTKETQHEAEEKLQELYEEAVALEGDTTLEGDAKRKAKIEEIKAAYANYMATYHRNEPFLSAFYAATYSAVPRGANEEENKTNYINAVRDRLKAIGITNVDDVEISLAYSDYIEKLKTQQKSMEQSAAELTAGAHPLRQGATVVEQLASDSNLTILDGGPGSGKSFSLGQAILKEGMEARPVVCLGSTPRAAKGLKKDMEGTVKDAGKTKEIYGGKSVDDFLEELDDDNLTPKAVETFFKKLGIPMKPKPVIMVDEAGLLNHKQMAKLMKVASLAGAKLILAGDCKQIPNGNEQPFKMLVDMYEKNPAVYANAPYINRAGMLYENVISNGVYNECNRDFKSAVKAFGSDKAVEYLTAGLQIDNTGFSKLGAFMPPLKAKMKPEEVKDFFIKDLKSYVEDIQKKGEEELKKILFDEDGKPKDPSKLKDEKEKKRYLAAVFIAHEMGVRAYNTFGQINQTNGNGDAFKDNTAHTFAEKYPGKGKTREQQYEEAFCNPDNYKKAFKDPAKAKDEEEKQELADLKKSLETLLGDRFDEYAKLQASYEQAKTDEEKKAIQEKQKAILKEKTKDAVQKAIEVERKGLKEKPAFQEGTELALKGPMKKTAFTNDPLLITATEREAGEMNDKIRKQLGKGPSLEVGEPIIVKGEIRYATEEDVRTIRQPHYAYALDVKTTQGMSQEGKVTYMVTKEGLETMQGGEILVGISRNKGTGFEIVMSDDIKKEDFYTRSVTQGAKYRYIHEDTVNVGASKGGNEPPTHTPHPVKPEEQQTPWEKTFRKLAKETGYVKEETIQEDSENPGRVTAQLQSESTISATGNNVHLSYKGEESLAKDCDELVKALKDQKYTKMNISPNSNEEFAKQMYLAAKRGGLEVNVPEKFKQQAQEWETEYQSTQNPPTTEKGSAGADGKASQLQAKGKASDNKQIHHAEAANAGAKQTQAPSRQVPVRTGNEGR